MSDTNEEPTKFVLRDPEDWVRWCYLLTNILESFEIIDLLDPVQAIRDAAVPERPDPETFGGAGALTVRMQSQLRDLQDVYSSKVKGRTKAADFIHESTLKHFMETVRTIPNRNDIYQRFVALKNHVRPLSTVAIHGRLNTALELRQAAPTRLAAQQFGQTVETAINDITSACQQAGITLEAVIR
jgi:hypothetical protein